MICRRLPRPLWYRFRRGRPPVRVWVWFRRSFAPPLALAPAAVGRLVARPCVPVPGAVWSPLPAHGRRRKVGKNPSKTPRLSYNFDDFGMGLSLWFRGQGGKIMHFAQYIVYNPVENHNILWLLHKNGGERRKKRTNRALSLERICLKMLNCFRITIDKCLLLWYNKDIKKR